MPQAFCPHCQAFKNMGMTVLRRKSISPDGKTKEIETKTFHCESCFTFVQSEDTEVAKT